MTEPYMFVVISILCYVTSVNHTFEMQLFMYLVFKTPHWETSECPFSLTGLWHQGTKPIITVTKL